ncbi:MAG: hypothetical protein M3442_02600 [Chloroflexota bacterium]|nr:hypothetical protein [Chloroflexota bacterium]
MRRRDAELLEGKYLRGFGLREGAHAGTVAHDSHNLVIAENDPADVLLAAQTLAVCGGASAWY